MNADATPYWEDFEAPDGGALIRIGIRRLVSDFWGPLLQPQYFHTWAEVLSPNRQPAATGPLAFGIYDKEHEGKSRAVLMDQSWEYEPEQVKKFDPTYLYVALPQFDRSDFQLVIDLCRSYQSRILGPYAFLVAWRRQLGHRDTHNCMTWVESFVRDKGGPQDILDRLEETLAAHLLGRSA